MPDSFFSRMLDTRCSSKPSSWWARRAPCELTPPINWTRYFEAHQAHSTTFIAQTIPFFGATEVFNYLRKTFPAYTYKEATLNPTNPRDRAADWEADVIQGFRNHSDETQMMGQRDTPEGESLWLAPPIKVEASCLECHSSPSTAPAALVKVYGRDNGFNWKTGDIVGAQISYRSPCRCPSRSPIASSKR